MPMPDPQNAIPGIEQAKPGIDELAAREEVIAIILFGSVARGQAREISDIDICVVTKKGAPEPVKMDLLSYGSEKTDVSLFYDLPITIRFRVIREGKLLFCRDTPVLHAIMADTVREYLDIAPFVRRNCFRALGMSEGNQVQY
jgi:predicted nucleotidyltransferase